jgi:hypothetical protein
MLGLQISLIIRDQCEDAKAAIEGVNRGSVERKRIIQRYRDRLETLRKVVFTITVKHRLLTAISAC